jgi:hypothetical protein
MGLVIAGEFTKAGTFLNYSKKPVIILYPPPKTAGGFLPPFGVDQKLLYL